MKTVAILEIILGLSLVGVSGYFMLQSATGSTPDLHGFLLGVTIFGTSLGALLAFAGAVLHSSVRYGIVAHIPFLAFAVVSYLTWFAAYA